MPIGKLGTHKLTGKLGMTALNGNLTIDYFRELLGKKRGGIKAFMLNQKNISGIGNVYIQDMLFTAKLHPNRAIQSLTEKEIEALYRSMKFVLIRSVKMGGLAYEKDFYGNKGRYGPKQFRVAYKPGKPCPACRTVIQKIKTGSTSSFICPRCQPLTNQVFTQ